MPQQLDAKQYSIISSTALFLLAAKVIHKEKIFSVQTSNKFLENIDKIATDHRAK